MPNKLYTVEISNTICVMAESADEAEDWCRFNRWDWSGDGGFKFLASPATDDVLGEWRESIPWNGDDDRTCAEVLAQVDRHINFRRPCQPSQSALSSDEETTE